METDVFIARQPIMDLKQQIIGYELFFRHSADADQAVVADDFKACANVLMSTVGDMDVKWLLGDKLAFINVDETMLMSELLELLAAQRTVLEVLRSVSDDPMVIERCQALKALGFKIALDNPHLRSDNEALIECADYIKVDIQTCDESELPGVFARLKGNDRLLVAEKVETHEQLNACKKIGFNCFQGYYFARPESFTAKVINPSFDSVLNLLNLASQEADNKVIEAGFKRDATLQYKLLRYINSVGFGLSCEVESIGHALTILGTKQLYRWLTLLMVTAGEGATSPVLMKNSITRGRLTELLGSDYFEKADRDNLFVVGVFSNLDAILKMPMEKILESVQLPEPVTDALLRREGIYGPFLQLAEACEDADSARIIELSESLTMEASHVNASHVSALNWVESIGF